DPAGAQLPVDRLATAQLGQRGAHESRETLRRADRVVRMHQLPAVRAQRLAVTRVIERMNVRGELEAPTAAPWKVDVAHEGLALRGAQLLALPLRPPGLPGPVGHRSD